MKKKVFITVKTYPVVSKSYDELVCTAGITEDGNWIRVYPVPFRKLDYTSQYPKYQWAEFDLVRNTKDPRPESYRPVVGINSTDIEVTFGEKIGTQNKWFVRKEIVLKNHKVYNTIETLLRDAKNKPNYTSLAIFKPKKVTDLIIKPVKKKDWSKESQMKLKQLNLFEQDNKSFRPVKKLPYDFFYIFEDINGIKEKMKIVDWEIGALYWNCLRSSNGDEKKAKESVKKRCLSLFDDKMDSYFFVGTTRAHHFKPKPFMIIGIFYPPKDNRMTLL